MNLVADRKGSRARASVWLVVGTAMAAAYVINGAHSSAAGYFVAASGWFALGASQAYRSLFDSPVTEANASEGGRATYAIARLVTWLSFLAIIAGIVIRWAP